MRKLKWILGGLFTLAVALAVAAYIVVSNYDPAELKALVQEEVRTATGRDLEIRGRLATRISLTPAVVMEDVRFANASWAATPEMATMRRLEVEVALLPLLSGDIEIKRLVMVEPSLHLERNAEGKANWDFGAGGGSSAQLPSFGALELEQGRVELRDEASGLHRSLRIDRLEAEGAATPMTVTMTGSLDEAPLDLELSLGSLADLLSGRATEIKAEGQVAGNSLSLDGRAALPGGEDGVTFTLAMEGDSLASLSAFAGGPLPARPYRLSTQVEQSGGLYRLKGMNGTLGESDVAGNLELDLSGERPRVTGGLISQTLHLADLRTEVPAEGQAAAAAQPDGLFPDDALPIAPLKVLDGKLTLSVGTLELERKTANDLQTTATLEQGQLALDPFNVTLGGAALTGRVEVKAAGATPQVALKLSGSGIDAGKLSDGMFTGTLSLALDVSGQGDSLKAVAASLNGESEVTSQGGALNSRFLAAASSGLLSAFEPLLGGDKQVQVVCSISRMQWQDGIGTSRGAAMDTDSFTVVGNGTVSLRDETLDFYLNTSAKDISLMTLAVPVRARGPLTSPEVVLDPAGTALGLARTAGLVIFPPAALAEIIGKNSQEGNPCLAAIQQVDQGGGPAKFFEDLGGAAKGAGETIEKGVDDAIEGIKGILGN